MESRPLFFAADRIHFFRPLTGKYREQVVACLRALYAHLYSSLADYSRIVQRELVIEVFGAWRPGYDPMLASLQAARVGGRPDLDRQRQIDPVCTGCEFADDVLLPAIRAQGFWDQERIAED